jgi:hypothetical protein
MADFIEEGTRGVETISNKQTARRRVLGWLGLGVAAAVIARTLPIKLFSRKKSVPKKSEKILISINKMAVKRNKKVTGNV